MEFDDIRLWIPDLDEESELTKWESDFLESIKEQLFDGGLLSEKQQEKLQDIWKKYFG